MSEKSTGRLVMVCVGIAVLVFLGLNLNLGGRGGPQAADAKKVEKSAEATGPAPADDPAKKPADFREYPIGDDVVRNEIRIAAVWLPPVEMEGMPGAASDLIHLEADIHATEGNRNGFAKDEFVPYLQVSYELRQAGDPATKAPILAGKMIPMVARDGLHYGANIARPGAGPYKLVYRIEPPSAGGLGRHADAATGVAAWWQPFDVSFDWDNAASPKAGD